MSGTLTVQLPQFRHHWSSFPGDAGDPSVLPRAAGDFWVRFPRPELMASIVGGVDVYQPDNSDTPPEIYDRTTGQQHEGETWWQSGRQALNANYPLRDVWAHELGHMAQHLYGITLGGDASGVAMIGVIAQALGFAAGDEEAWASAFGAYLLGQRSEPLFYWFPDVLAIWRAISGRVSDAFYSQGLFQWWAADAQRWERFQEGNHRYLASDGTWMEAT